MSNNDFIKGLSYAINREELATMLGCAPSNNYFSDEYLIDPENCVVYNDTKYHQENIAELTDGTQYGYNFDYAVESFRKAAEELISQGAYWYGDTIEIEIAWMSQSDENKYHIYIKNYIESAWSSANTGLNLNVTFWCGTRWDEVYYDKMMAGQFDIAWGSISGNPLNPINFLEVLKSDNSSGFTLNWGSDTSQVSPELFYDGMYWSFDSLWYAADKGGYFENGKQVPVVYIPENLPDGGYVENADGTVTISFDIEIKDVEGLSADIIDVRVFSYITDENNSNSYEYAEESVSFTYNNGRISTTLTREQLALYRDQCYANAPGNVGIDVYYTVSANGIDLSTFNSVYFNWAE
jgi:hypothetical protein